MSTLNNCPSFQLKYIEKAAALINQAPRGVLGILLFDETPTAPNEAVYYSSIEIKENIWNEKNYQILKFLAFKGNPFKVNVYKATPETLNDVLKSIEEDEPDYLCCPILQASKSKAGTSVDDLISWINSIRNSQGIQLGKDTSTIKLVVSATSAPNKEWIIDYDARQIKHEIHGLDGVYFTAQEYTVCIASMCAGVPLNSSITSMAQPWIKYFKTEVTDLNTAIGQGKLLTTYDGKNYIILRGITSFTTPTDSKNRSFSKIRKMEIMDIHQKNIRNIFKESYRGKYQNLYPDKLLLLGAINGYLAEFVKAGQLDPAYENKMVIDIKAHRNYLISKGVYKKGPITEEEVNKLSDYELLRINTDDIVFAYIPEYKPTDVMEDFVGEAYL